MSFLVIVSQVCHFLVGFHLSVYSILNVINSQKLCDLFGCLACVQLFDSADRVG